MRKSPLGYCPRCRKAIYIPFIDHYDRCHPAWQTEPVDRLDAAGQSITGRIALALKTGEAARVDGMLRDKDLINKARGRA